VRNDLSALTISGAMTLMANEPNKQTPFARLPTEVRDVVLDAGQLTQLAQDDVLFRQHDVGDSMYIIETGEVRISFEDRVETKVLGPGQYLGEIALFAPGVDRTATATAHTDCQLRVLDQHTMEQLKDQRPDVLCSLLQETTAYLVASEQHLVADLRKRNAELERAFDYLRRTQEELEASDLLAHTDELTGLYNRRCLNVQMPKFVDRAENTRSELAVLLVDLDKFKPINDTYGHGVGDLVLKEVASRLKNGTRKTDLPCRIGGDEFAILLGNTQHDAARERAASIQRSIAELDIPAGDQTLKITVSMGGAMYQTGDETHTLLKRADDSLYLAKDGGRNRLGWMGKLYE